jgi:hypothetical protein
MKLIHLYILRSGCNVENANTNAEDIYQSELTANNGQITIAKYTWERGSP